MSQCEFPLCKTNALPGKLYCVPHNRVYGTPTIKPVKPINKVSSKMEKVKEELKKLYSIFLGKHKSCKIKSPECTALATCVHHLKGRGENELMDKSTWVASCEHCNSYVEQHHTWAEERGFKISRHKIETTNIS
jgi:hypothetical protein